jgi:hypothetical protein
VSGRSETKLIRGNLSRFAALFIACLIFSCRLAAQGVCDQGNGPLDPAQPAGIAPAEIIQKFMDKEATLKAARDRYGYTLNVTIQTLDDSGQVDGEYRQVSEVVLEDSGKRVERATYAPESTLRKIALSEDDLDDIHERIPFPLKADELPLFSATYAGRQRVDQLKTYVFNVSPKDPKKKKMLFEGRIWVDDQELVIVKTCGKPRPDEIPTAKRKNVPASITPVFVTYREQFDGRMWFPTYSKADEYLPFPKHAVHVREVMKYSNYKLLAGK